jgi:crotonobetainyl-CoA:carnitine CoA-transferase CaiB-like acyl-CoA transferase
MAGPLEGILVVDLTRALAGPYCTLLLGDLGADVIKIEPPEGDESRGWGPPFLGGESAYFLAVNRNKRSVVLDLKGPAGRAALERLVARADVLVENVRPGVLARLGMSYERARALNPRLVYASISGFGQTGPRATQPAYDQVLQGLGGVMSLTGQPDGPPTKFGLPIADLAAGLFAAVAINAALFHRARTGEGQYLDASLLAGQVALLSFQAARYFATGQAPKRIGNRHPTIAPYETFPTADGWINVACGTERMWRSFCGALGLEELLADPRFQTNADRVANREALAERLAARFAELETTEAVARLEAADVPAGPVYDLAQVFADPQVRHLQLERTVSHPTAGPVRQTGFPFNLSATPPEIRRPAPRLGEHTAEVLRWLEEGAG